MNITPNRELLYSHPQSYKLMLMVHYALVYLETCVDEAPFGFVSKESEQFKSIEIPKEICVSYKEYLHRCLSKKNCLSGFYGVWMKMTSEDLNQDVVVLTMFQQQELDFSVVIPIPTKHLWWVARDL